MLFDYYLLFCFFLLLLFLDGVPFAGDEGVLDSDVTFFSLSGAALLSLVLLLSSLLMLLQLEDAFGVNAVEEDAAAIAFFG